MWCELVLNGVGGRTIAEAQATLSYPEFMVWMKYRAKRGSLNSGMRVEQELSKLRAIYINAHSKEGAAWIYAEDLNPSMEPRVITLEELAAQMGA